MLLNSSRSLANMVLPWNCSSGPLGGSIDPERTLALAAFLGRRNRVTEALDLCEKIWASCRPEDIAATMAAVLYSRLIDDAHCRRAAQLIETEMQKSARVPGLLFHLGNIRSLQGRYQDAEALYRQSFARDQTNSGPLTNLAWLLVRREGKGTEALQLVTEAILKDGPTPDLLDTRALAYMAMGQSDLAIKDLEDAVGVRPSPLKYVHLARRIFWPRGEMTRARLFSMQGLPGYARKVCLLWKERIASVWCRNWLNDESR